MTGEFRERGRGTDGFEARQRLLDPHRVEEQRRAREEAEDRLRKLGIPSHAQDGDEDSSDLLDAVDRFEAAVEAHGGDLLVNRLETSEPQDREFVLPVRGATEAITDYRLRIEAATDRVRQRRRT